MVASGASGSGAVTVYRPWAFTSTHQPSPATMNPRSRICGSPVEGQYTSDTMPCPSVAHTRAAPSDVVTASFGAAAMNGPTGRTGDGAPTIINTPHQYVGRVNIINIASIRNRSVIESTP